MALFSGVAFVFYSDNDFYRAFTVPVSDVSRAQLPASTYRSSVAVDATSGAPNEAVIFITSDGASPFTEPLSPDRGRCRE